MSCLTYAGSRHLGCLLGLCERWRLTVQFLLDGFKQGCRTATVRVCTMYFSIGDVWI